MFIGDTFRGFIKLVQKVSNPTFGYYSPNNTLGLNQSNCYPWTSPILSFANNPFSNFDISSFYHIDSTNNLGWMGLMGMPEWLQMESFHLNDMWAMFNDRNFTIPRTYATGYQNSNIISGDVFNKALNITLGYEGGYSNSQYDKGGKTNYGITHSTYDAWRKEHHLPTQDVRNITKEEVTQIYNDYYWVPSGASKIAQTDPKLAIAVFDTAVLHGVGGAKKFLKQSGNDLNKFLELRTESYNKIVAKDKTQEKFKRGWDIRVANLGQKLKKMFGFC